MRLEQRCGSCGRNLPKSGQHLCPPILDLTGHVFERLTVVEMAPGKLRRSRLWKCICQCGNVKVTSSHMLRTGHAKSCGCLNVEKYSTPRKHGACNTPEYTAWKDMKRRCFNEHASNYRRYGERGISICERWLDFSNFLADMGPRPSSEMSIERVNNDGNYEPGNCIWATAFVQANNTCRNRYLEIDGRRQTVSQWALERGLDRGIVRRRLDRGMAPELAIA